mmetsp:Transcript_53872/g.128292  ORF Transcript_53872/g.128292 Transcript_53872/m.128292 type:complete len:175 (-) Transcript_53872:82-606(-)
MDPDRILQATCIRRDGCLPLSSALKESSLRKLEGTATLMRTGHSVSGKTSSTTGQRRVRFGETHYESIPSCQWMSRWMAFEDMLQTNWAEDAKPMSKEEKEEEEEVDELVKKYLACMDQRRGRRSITCSLEHQLLDLPEVSRSKLWARRARKVDATDPGDSMVAIAASRQKPNI